MSDFQNSLAELQKKQEALDAEKQHLRYQAVNEVQRLITQFGIKAEELTFDGSKGITRRKPSKIKYRTPNGITWTGKGNPKKALMDYLTSMGETLADLKKYEVKVDAE